jgi:hypothetical protein
MDSGPARGPLIEGRGVLGFRDFCLSTGLDEATVEALMRSGTLPGALFRAADDRPSGLFEDQLLTRDELLALGLPVREEYDPEHPRYGGIKCPTHGWAPTFLVRRYDAAGAEMPDRIGCWECEQAGLPIDEANSVAISDRPGRRDGAREA